MKKPAAASTATLEAVWLRADAFFVRRIAWDASVPAASQVELALEATGPFATEQLYYGHLVAPDGRAALVFATHRRVVPGDGWPEAPLVLPTLVALLGAAPDRPLVRVWHHADVLTVAAWDGTGVLPAWVLARQTEPDNADAVRQTLLAEVFQRLGQKPEIDDYSGPLEATLGRNQDELELRLKASSGGKTLVTIFPRAVGETLDVRDKAVLGERRRALRRDRVLWGAVIAAIVGLVLAGGLEAGLWMGGKLLQRQRAEQAGRADEVQRIETAQTLSSRIAEMAQRRLRPLEMLAVLNLPRPASVQFIRCVSSGLNTLEIEGQTADAAGVGAYEAALRGLPELESFEIRDVRLREGTTTFQLTAVFKPDALVAGNGGTP